MMALTEIQTNALKAKLNHRHVKTRENNGATISYVEGWHVIAEANRIFGFDSWDRLTHAPDCVWSTVQRGQTVCFYTTKVRITVRAGGTITVREGIGTGLGRSSSPEVAHEIALKAAETDATKRALATFGNPFGLALYDRDQTLVTKPRRAAAKAKSNDIARPLVLVMADGRKVQFETAGEFVDAALAEVREFTSVERAYGFWTANLAAFTALPSGLGDDGGSRSADTIIAALKDHLRKIVSLKKEQELRNEDTGHAAEADAKRPVLIPKEKRIRDRQHLAFVASQPCLVCGRRPAQAHHVRFAQPRAMGMKVSDEFTLPLCNTHHDALHRTGDERAWWARHGIIDPLKIAARLWEASRLSSNCDEPNGADARVPPDAPQDTEGSANPAPPGL